MTITKGKPININERLFVEKLTQNEKKKKKKRRFFFFSLDSTTFKDSVNTNEEYITSTRKALMVDGKSKNKKSKIYLINPSHMKAGHP